MNHVVSKRVILAVNYASKNSMPAVLIMKATITQNSPFSPLTVTVAIASTHVYSLRDGQAELVWVAGLK